MPFKKFKQVFQQASGLTLYIYETVSITPITSLTIHVNAIWESEFTNT